MEYQHLNHCFSPIYNSESRILILGSFPSVKSRENNFYYGHPQNRFWKVISKITCNEFPKTIEEKKELLLKNNIALWDVIKSCSIQGSSDNSIKDVIVNDFTVMLRETQIKKIFTNGTKADELYNRYVYPIIEIPSIKLPSTSPANAAYNLDLLYDKWKEVLSF